MERRGAALVVVSETAMLLDIKCIRWGEKNILATAGAQRFD